MYITSDLFAAHDASPLSRPNILNTTWPTMAVASQIMPSAGALGKRKRKSEVAEQSKQSAFLHKSDFLMHDTRQAFSLLPPPELAVQMINATSYRELPAAEETLAQADGSLEPPRPKMRRKILSPKLHRVVLSEAACGNKMGTRTISKPNSVEPCHVCKTSPKLKSDLMAYTDCERCHRRTCLICSRACHAHCGRKKVCSTCCEERGLEGDAWCLDCVGHSRDLDMHE